MTIYCVFRKVDRVLLYVANREEQANSEWIACLANEGGGPSDYIRETIEGPIPAGMIPSHTEADEIVYIRKPTVVAREATRAGLAVKLGGLGMTPDEIDLLI